MAGDTDYAVLLTNFTPVNLAPIIVGNASGSQAAANGNLRAEFHNAISPNSSVSRVGEVFLLRVYAANAVVNDELFAGNVPIAITYDSGIVQAAGQAVYAADVDVPSHRQVLTLSQVPTQTPTQVSAETLTPVPPQTETQTPTLTQSQSPTQSPTQEQTPAETQTSLNTLLEWVSVSEEVRAATPPDQEILVLEAPFRAVEAGVANFAVGLASGITAGEQFFIPTSTNWELDSADLEFSNLSYQPIAYRSLLFIGLSNPTLFVDRGDQNSLFDFRNGSTVDRGGFETSYHVTAGSSGDFSGNFDYQIRSIAPLPPVIDPVPGPSPIEIISASDAASSEELLTNVRLTAKESPETSQPSTRYTGWSLTVDATANRYRPMQVTSDDSNRDGKPGLSLTSYLRDSATPTQLLAVRIVGDGRDEKASVDVASVNAIVRRLFRGGRLSRLFDEQSSGEPQVRVMSAEECDAVLAEWDQRSAPPESSDKPPAQAE